MLDERGPSRAAPLEINRWTLRLAALSLLAVTTAAYLLQQHLAHMLGFLPYLLLAACPLMHLFHHGHHRQ